MFAIKTYNNLKFNSWFIKKEEKVLNTRSNQQFLKEVPARTKRYDHSLLPVITKILIQITVKTLKRHIKTFGKAYSKQAATKRSTTNTSTVKNHVSLNGTQE